MHNALDRRLLLGSAGLAGAAALASFSRAGPLNPPAGPVASTSKPLGEIEPRMPISAATTPGNASALYVINQPGSYYLTGNVVGVAGKGGILINAHNVTIDLMGFEMRGVEGSGDGVFMSTTGLSRSAVLNGGFIGWNSAVRLMGGNSLVQGVCVFGAAVYGVHVGVNSRILDCLSVTTGNAAFSGDSAVISRCSATGSAVAGFQLIDGGVVTDCTASGNTGDGFGGDNGVVFHRCEAEINTGSGFVIGATSTASQCVSRQNQLMGFSVAGGSVLDCIAQRNRLHGILVNSDSVVRGNASSFNGLNGVGHGIQVFGNGNRIESNHCTRNDRGIDVTGTGNLVVRNSVSGNGEFGYAVVAGNGAGPNIVTAAALAASNNPHANYEF